MKKARKEYIKSCEISEVVTVNLGGFEQKIAVEGRKRDLPVVICLHGGPGSPVPFSVGARGLFPAWTDKAVMVYWDQLGCGINNCKIDNSFSIDSFVSMTCDLVKEIKNRFPKNKVYLFGISWGSALALKAALKIPDLLDGAFCYGQLLRNNFFSEEMLEAFSSAPKKVRKEIEKIVKTGSDCEYKILDRNLKKRSKYLSKYTDGFINKKGDPVKIGEIAKGLLSSPDYRFRDFMAVVKNGYRGNESLVREVLTIDLAKNLCDIRIPYFIVQGDTDLVTLTKTACEAVQNCGNENVTIKIVKDSGHLPSRAAMAELLEALAEFMK